MIRTPATALPYFLQISHASMRYSFYVSLGITGSDTLPPLLMDGKRQKKSPNRGIGRGGGRGGRMIIMIYCAYWVLCFPGENTLLDVQKNAHFYVFLEIHYGNVDLEYVL